MFVADRGRSCRCGRRASSASGPGAWHEQLVPDSCRRGRCSAVSRSPRCCCSWWRRALLSPFRLDLLGQYLCFAMVAVGIGLAWGRGGMLTLGQGVFFGLGAYVMAMHLKLADAGPGRGARLHGADLVGRSCRGWWEPFRSRAGHAAGDPGAARPLVAAVLGSRDLPPPGRAARTSRSCPRRWPRRSRSCSSATRPRTGGIDRAEQLPRLLRLRPRRPGEPADAVLHRRRASCC